MIGADFGLFEQGGDQTIGDAAMLGAFTNRMNGGVKGQHGVINHNAAFAMNAGFLRQLDIGADANGHHDQISINF